MNGICYGTLATDVSAFEREGDKHWLPIFDGPKQREFSTMKSYFNYAYAQLGFSLHMNSRNHDVDIILGSPGVFVWKGDAILISTAFNKSTSYTIIPSVVGEAQLDYHDYFGNIFYLAICFNM